ncbi:MAG: hypothetical protein RLP15_10560 [Cryomorphaceae bacterium]
MKKAFHLILWAILVALIGTSCRPLYRASIPNQPMITERGQAEVDIGVETGSGYLNASYSLSDHLFVTAGGNAYSSNHTTAQFAELGAGYYSFNKERRFGTSVMGQIGFGYAEVIRDESVSNFFEPGDIELIEYDVQFLRFGVTPSAYWKSDHVDVALGMRNSMLYWLSPSEFQDQEVDGIDIFVEPVVSVQTGSAVTKFFLESSLQIPIYRSFSHPVSPIHLGFGISFLISKSALTGYTQGKALEQ